MYKIGMKFKSLKTIYPFRTEGKVYTIIHNSERIWYINDIGEEMNTYDLDSVQLIKRELKTETDYLDAFQENFRDGE